MTKVLDTPMSEDFYKQCTHAQTMLADPLFDEVFAVVEAIYIDEWKNPDTKRKEREMAWVLVQGLHDVHKSFRILAEKKVAYDLQQEAEDSKKKSALDK